MVLCSTTGGSGGSRMSRRLDADEPAADVDAVAGFILASFAPRLLAVTAVALAGRHGASGSGPGCAPIAGGPGASGGRTWS